MEKGKIILMQRVNYIMMSHDIPPRCSRDLIDSFLIEVGSLSALSLLQHKVAHDQGPGI